MDTTARRFGVLPAQAASSWVRFVVVGIAAALCLTLLPAAPAHAADRRTVAEIRNRVEYLVNRDRDRHGLRRLRVSSRIQYYATDHARRMAAAGTIFHDFTGLGAETLVRATAWGENVGHTTATDAARHGHSLFMGSTTHRANVLRRRWTHMGIGVAKRGGTTYIVQRFADAN